MAKLQDSAQTSKNLASGSINSKSTGSKNYNDLASNAKVAYPASSNLMGTDSHNRGPGGK